MPADLDAIRIKVRRITRAPSEAQLTTANLDEYINTFVLYDFPEQLRLFNLHETLTFYTEPNIDTYSTVTANPNDPLFNFKNRFITINPPIYAAGFKCFFSQSREEFFNVYPIVNTITQVAVGDGVTLAFAGTLTNIPVLRDNVVFSSVDINGNGLELHDLQPGIPPTGALFGTGNGVVNYVTGVFNIAFNTAPAAGQAINSQTIPYVANRPESVLFYDATFTLRPVPDQPYPINMEVYVQPTELLAQNEEPKLAEWWQYIAYGASKKVFEDRNDLDSVNLIMPEFKQQERLILRRTIVQQTTERTATIYTDNTAGAYGPGWFFGGGNF